MPGKNLPSRLNVTGAVVAAIAALSFGTASATDEESSSISVAFDAGLIWYFGERNDIWRSGTIAGVTGLYPVNSTLSVGGRIGLNHWDYNDAGIVAGLVPCGAEILSSQSTGQLQMIEFGPVARLGRDRFFADHAGLFLQLSTCIVYVKTFALSEVMFSTGGFRAGVRSFEINHSRYRPGVAVSGGFTRPVTRSSWIDLVPSYRGVYDEGSITNLVGVSLAYRAKI